MSSVLGPKAYPHAVNSGLYCVRKQQIKAGSFRLTLPTHPPLSPVPSLPFRPLPRLHYHPNRNFEELLCECCASVVISRFVTDLLSKSLPWSATKHTPSPHCPKHCKTWKEYVLKHKRGQKITKKINKTHRFINNPVKSTDRVNRCRICVGPRPKCGWKQAFLPTVGLQCSEFPVKRWSW